MAVASFVAEIETGMGEAVLKGLALLDQVSVYGVKENRIVVVVEAASLHAIEDIMKRIQAIGHVTGLYPVFSVDE
jgi:nitrate reductase NapAB chaperone NapD